MPTLTFLATANTARYVGAEVAFADVDADTGLAGVAQFEAALDRCADRNVKAIFPVHLNGQCADPAALAELAAARGLRVVEDACHALGTTWRTASGDDVPVGSCRYSDMAVFSFHPVKAIAMGEGGMITTNDARLDHRLRRLRSHGMTRDPDNFQQHDLAFAADGTPNPWYYEMPEVGFNYRANDLQCALGLSQLGKLDRFVARRRALAARYDELLAPLAPLVRPVARVPDCRPAWHIYVVAIDYAGAGMARGDVMRRLRDAGIGTQVHYLPVHLQPYYRGRYGDLTLDGAGHYYAWALTLPLHAGMDDSDVDRVVDALRAALSVRTKRADMPNI